MCMKYKESLFSMKAKRKHRRKKQRGGALYRRKPSVVDKIAEGASMFLSGLLLPLQRC